MVAQRKKRKGNPVTRNNHSNSLQVLFNQSLEPERLIWVLSYSFLWIDWFLWFYLFPLVNGGWSIWSSWTSCNQSCGIGSQERSRNCTRPSPSYGGKPCQGVKREKQMCNKQPCTLVRMLYNEYLVYLIAWYTCYFWQLWAIINFVVCPSQIKIIFSKVFKCSYFMIQTFCFVIQQPLLNIQQTESPGRAW